LEEDNKKKLNQEKLKEIKKKNVKAYEDAMHRYSKDSN
jgi:hypothetical protein